MSKIDIFLMLMIVAVVFSVFVLGAHLTSNESDIRFDKCLQAVNEAIPDPNEIQERSDFLRNCYE